MSWFDLFLIEPLAILIRNLRQPYHIAHVEEKPGRLRLDHADWVPSSPQKKGNKQAYTYALFTF